MLSIVRAIVAGRPARRGQQTDPLVIADGLDLGVGSAPQFPDRQEVAYHGLDPVVATGSTWVVMSNLSR